MIDTGCIMTVLVFAGMASYSFVYFVRHHYSGFTAALLSLAICVATFLLYYAALWVLAWLGRQRKKNK